MHPKANGSQQSASMPSTPRRRPRDASSASPTPRVISENHTPVAPSIAPVRYFAPAPVSGQVEMLFINGHAACKFDLNSQFLGKRRMQYNLGDAPLEAPHYVKERLTMLEDNKLTTGLMELSKMLQPTKESEERRGLFIAKLEAVLRKEWPGNEFKAHVFGSSGNMLYTSDSDVDICIQTPLVELGSMHQIAAVLVRNGMEKVVCVPAKVPIVKMWDPELDMAADINVNNTLALENTRMVKSYVMIDPRVRPLAMIIKHWTRRRVLNDAGPGGTISSYAWICMIIHFLQTRQPPVLPALHSRPHREYRADDGSEAGYDDQIQNLEGFGNANLESLGALVFHFFRYYAFEFDYEKSVVCVRKGEAIPRTEKNWGPGTPGGLWSLCIEEPFNQTRNLGNSCDATAFRGIHMELRTAFIAVSTLDLASLMEPFEFKDGREDKTPFKIGPISGPAPPSAPATRNRPAIVTSDPLTVPSRGHPSTGGGKTRHSDRGVNGGAGGARAAPAGPSNRRASNGPTVAHNGQYPSSQNPFPASGEYYATDVHYAPVHHPREAMMQAQVHNLNVMAGRSQHVFVPQPSFVLEQQNPHIFVPAGQVARQPNYPGYSYVSCAGQIHHQPAWTRPPSPGHAPALLMGPEASGVGTVMVRGPGRAGPLHVGFSPEGRPLYSVPLDLAPYGWSGDYAYYAYATDRNRTVDQIGRKEYVGYYWVEPPQLPPPNAAFSVARRALIGRPSRSTSPSRRTAQRSDALRQPGRFNLSSSLAADVGSPPKHPAIDNGSCLEKPPADEELITPHVEAPYCVTSANKTSHTDPANAVYQSTPYPNYLGAPQGPAGFLNDVLPPPALAYNPAPTYSPYVPTQAFSAYADPGMTAAAYGTQPVLPNMSPAQHYEQSFPQFTPFIQPAETGVPPQSSVSLGEQFGPPLQPFMPAPYVPRLESNRPNKESKTPPTHVAEPSKGASPNQTPSPQPKQPAPIPKPRIASSSATRHETETASAAVPKPSSSSSPPPLQAAARVAMPLRAARADGPPRDPTARQMMAILNNNAAADAAARRGSEASLSVPAPASVWQQVPYASKRSKMRRRSTSRSSSSARTAIEAGPWAEPWDAGAGAAPAAATRGAADRGDATNDPTASPAVDAADRRAKANARLMGLPQAAASRAHSRIKELLSAEEDGRQGG